MAISVQCQNPDCGQSCRVKDEFAGKGVKCPGCGQRMLVPTGNPPPTDNQPVKKPERQAEKPTREKQLERPTRQAVWPWLLGMAATLLVGAGGGYFLAASQGQKSKDPPGQSTTDDSELRKVRAELQGAREELAKLKADTTPPKPNPGAKDKQPKPDPGVKDKDPKPNPGTRDTQKDAENIRGVWKSVDENVFPFGKPVVIASYQDRSVFSVLGLTLSYKLDPKKTPQTIDLINSREGKTYTGIYELKGDLLNIAVHLDGKTRPTNYILSAQDKENDKKGKSTKWVFLLRRQSK